MSERGDQRDASATRQPFDMHRSFEGIGAFYDALSPFYHLIYQDWNASVDRQAQQLDSIIREYWGDRVHDVLDAACGIGTQAIGLARRGYSVTATDLSGESLERARRSAIERGVSIEVAVDDMRTLESQRGRRFDLVIACDNAIPHLLTDADILAALRALHERLRPGGGCILSVRDYAVMDMTGTKLVPFGVRRDGDKRYIVFQVWECDDVGYNLHFYFVEDQPGATPITHVVRSRYRSLTIDKLVEFMRQSGFQDVKRIDGRFFQPLVLGSA